MIDQNLCIVFYFNSNSIFIARAEADKMAHQAQVLWSACQALYRSIKAGCPGVPWKEQIRPLEPEITAVTKAAGRFHIIYEFILKKIKLNISINLLSAI